MSVDAGASTSVWSFLSCSSPDSIAIEFSNVLVRSCLLTSPVRPDTGQVERGDPQRERRRAGAQPVVPGRRVLEQRVGHQPYK